MRYPPGSNDWMYDAHLWFGPGYERPIAADVLEMMTEVLGKTPREYVYEGDDAVRDEIAVLELGPHVEMEMVSQDMAPVTHGSIEYYLECLLMTEVDIDELLD